MNLRLVIVRFGIVAFLFAIQFPACSQILIHLQSPKISGQKTVIPLLIENKLTNEIKAARVTLFVRDGKGVVIANAARWVVSGSSKPVRAGANAEFNFVITTRKKLHLEDLKTDLVVNRVILSNDAFVDFHKDMKVLHDK